LIATIIDEIRARSFSSYFKRGDSLAFLIVVFVSYLLAFSLRDQPYTPLEVLIISVAGLIYTVIGLIGSEVGDRLKSLPFSISFFLVELILGSWIVFLSNAAAWMILFPLASMNVTLFPRKAMIVVNTFLWSTMIGVIWLLSGDWLATIRTGLAYGGAIVFVVVFTQILVIEQKTRIEVERLANELEGANRKLREYAVQVEELATAQERNRLAREIHDGLGHYLTAVNIQIKAAQAVMSADPERAQDALNKAQTLAQEALLDVRRSVASLRASPTENRPLHEALFSLIEECRASGLDITLETSGVMRILAPKVELALYRAVQEGLTNVRKHAQATHARVRLDYQSGRVCLQVEDDGKGVEPSGSSAEGFGLMGLHERVTLLGGQMQIHSVPGEGFQMKIEIPVGGAA